ncbi:MAG TPA: BamA/TamA family outer membrane protein [Gemmatimonadaceae bacterium]|nr:BamA/TamA family outer membrane protein [Gemmatimonadaceae bacterium]
MRLPVSPWVAAFAVGVTLAVSPQRMTAQNTHDMQREAPEVRQLVFKGVVHIDVRDLERSISTQVTKCRSLLLEPFCLIGRGSTFQDRHYFSETEFRRDVLRIRLYYWKRGYRDAEVDTSVVRTGPRAVRVTFDVHENQPTTIRKISISYDSTLISGKIRDRLTLLRAKDPLDLIVLDSMRVLFQNELWDRGYGDATVDTSVVVDTATKLADVGLLLTNNRITTVGRVTVRGAERVDVATIRRSITFREGGLFRQSDVLESQRNLYESNLFRLATIDVPTQFDSVKNVNIDVTEAPLHEARMGPGITNVDFLQFQAHYTSYNLFGGARRLDVDGTIGNLLASSLQGRGTFRNIRSDLAKPDTNISPYVQPTYTASIDFKQPAFLQRPAEAVGVGAFAHRNINPGVFIDRGVGGTATYTHQLTIRAPLSLNYRYEINRVLASDVYFCVNFGVCDSLTIGTLRSHQSLSPLTLTGFIDRSDIPFSPTKGYVARVDFEHASAYTASDYRYNRLFLDAAVYGHKSRTQNVYSAHLRMGWVRPVNSGADIGLLHPRKRFYAGGANSVRGYAENQLGPRILTIDDSTLVKGATSINGGTCALTVDAVKFCDPNSPKLKAIDFIPQPLGGTSLIEGSVEYRMPLPLGPHIRNFVGAVFVDGGIVGSGSIRGIQTITNIVKGTAAITPGFGIRYMSPVGPIRVDFGINPSRAEALGVVTAVRDSTGQRRIVPLGVSRNFANGKTLLDRLILHFSIGEAF